MYWSNALGFIASSIGAAVGLGSLWFLPYQVFTGGGAIFFVLFCFFTLSVGIWALRAEIIIGYTLKQSLYKGLPIITPLGSYISYFFYLTLGLIASFYSVVTSQVLFCFLSQLAYLLNITTNPLSLPSLIEPLEKSLILSLGSLFTFWSIFYAVMALPIQKGLEKYSKLLIGALILTLLILIFQSHQNNMLLKGFTYLFISRWDDVSWISILNAFSTALFGLAVGAGCMISYGSYLERSQLRYPLNFCVIVIALACLFISFISCLSLFPYVLGAEKAFTSGPNLVFEVLPVAFSSLKYGGNLLATLYMMALFIAGLTSCFSLVEPFILLICERYQYSRPYASLLIVTIFLFLSSMIVFDNHYQLLQVMNFSLRVVTQLLLPLGVLCVFYLYYRLWQKKYLE